MSNAIAVRPTVGEFLSSIGASHPTSEPDNVTLVAGGAIGAVLYKKNRVLGAIAGASIGRNVPAVLHVENRRNALCNMGETGAGVVGSLLGERYGHPVVGFAVGWLAGKAAVFYGGFRK